MAHHQVPEPLRHVSDMVLPISPPPSRFLRHADTIDPITETYADLFRTRHGFPMRAEALERFLEFDLQLPYGWQDIPEPEVIHILAQHDPTTGTIHANNRYAAFFEAHPHLLASALSHELGHVVLRHGELYADADQLSLDGVLMSSPFLHRAGVLPWGVDEDLLRRAVKVSLMDDQIRTLLKPERFEPGWVYTQAQCFAAAFMISHARLREELKEVGDCAHWPAIYELTRRFATSPSMMRYRLEQLGYIMVHGKEVAPGVRLRQKLLL